MSNTGDKRKRKRREAKPQRPCPVDSSCTSSSSSSPTISDTSTQPLPPAVREIPGYTWHATKKRYFKIMSSGAAPSHHPFSEGNLRRKEKAELMIQREKTEECKLSQRSFNGALPFRCAREIGLQRTCRGLVCDVKLRLGRSLKRVGVEKTGLANYVELVDMQIHPHRNHLYFGEQRGGRGSVSVLSFNADKESLMTTSPLPTEFMNSPLTSLSLGPSDTLISTFLGGAGESGSLHIDKCDPTHGCIVSDEAFSYSPTQTSVWASDVIDNTAVIGASRQVIVISGWESRNASPAIAMLHTGSDVLSIALEKSSGQKVVAGCRDGTIRIFDLRSPRQTPSFHGIVPGMKHKSSIYSVTSLRNGWGVLGAAKDGSINLWDIRSAGYRDNRSDRIARPVTEYMDNINESQKLGLCVDEDETMFLAAGYDSKIRGYSLRSAGAQCHPFLTTTKLGGSICAIRCVGSNRGSGLGLETGEGVMVAVNTLKEESESGGGSSSSSDREGRFEWWAG